MGNTDSQYSNFIIPGKGKSSSLKLHTSKEEALSPHSWWRSSQSTSGYKDKNVFSPHKNSQPYISRHYDCIKGGSSDKVHSESHRDYDNLLFQGNGFFVRYRQQTGGLPAPTRSTSSELKDNKSSPKVLFREDGSLRVEFTNAQREPDVELSLGSCLSGPVDAIQRASNGSSLSSEGSWYDSPWGNGTEDLCDNIFTTGQPSDNSSGYTTLSSTRTMDFGCFNGYNTEQSENHMGNLTSSLTSSLDVNSQDESQKTQNYTSQTLPCRKAVPDGNTRKDSLKSRIRRLSDWTGSLSRKKRRLQVRKIYIFFDVVGCGTGVTLEESRPFWNPVSPQTQLDCSGSSTGPFGQQNQSAALRQNIYENFMQGLETGSSSGTADGLQVWEGEGESSSGSMGSLEQMDFLFEKEQGVVRRAGWLAFKPLITLHKDRKLELVARRKWRQYWVTLKGCTLLLGESNGKTSPEQECTPHYAVLAEDSILQAVPEHPKKEHVFCLSNAYGDVYLFQAANQTDLENWVTAIHSASASHLAKRQGKEDTLRLLKSQSRALLQKIDMDGKMKKMAELQLSVISDQKNRKAIESQILQWEQNLEKFNLELFRMRCYLASLQGTELPNPKSLLATAGRPSKMALGRLGIFSVSSFHALICTRDEATLKRRSRSHPRGMRNKRGLLFSSQKGLDSLTKRNREKRQSLSQVRKLDGFTKLHVTAPPEGNPWECSLESRVYVLMPDSQVVSVPVKPDSVVADVLSVACKVIQSPLTDLLTSIGNDQKHQQLKFMHLHFLSFVVSCGWFRPHEMTERVHDSLKAGDEILTLNGVSVASLDLGFMQSFFSQQELHLVLRREDNSTDEQSSVWPDCDPSEPDQPQPPRANIIHLEQWTTGRKHYNDPETVCNLYQTFPEGSVLVPEGHRNPYSTENALARSSPRHMSVTERLRMVIQELVETEKSYVKDLGSLFEIYLKPLQRETFLSHDEMESLFGSLPEMLDFQRVFLQTLEERTTSSPEYHALETPEKLKKLLFSLGGSFLYYADHFKLYSGFCANHIKVQKVLERAKTDQAFKEFLEARNPTKQHSSTLESYLIKPVQRVLKYPLLLRELVSLTDPESDEHSHLTEALKAMEKVASHINEMQKIYEDYGTVFDQLVAEQSGPEKEVTEISMGEFIIHSSALWQNPLPSLGRMRKDPELTLFRKSDLIYCNFKKHATSSRPGDLDPFKFRWLIPVSSLQVRPGNSAGSENPCVWEVVHTKSEVEGRPEMSFQLCSSNLENKANAVRAIRTLLRENAKRTAPVERRFKDLNSNFTFPRRNHLGALRTNSWQRLPPQSDEPKTSDSDEGRLLDGYAHSEPPLRPSRGQSSTLSKRSTLCSLTSALEAQLQRLNFVEEPQGMSKSSTSSLQGSQVTLLDDTPGLDLNTLLARDYSVQSFGPVVNEDCFYDTIMGIQKAAIPTL
uniref:T-lymphoma invasion and metastasis-inducing protein 2-like n=1 Tax=Sinocyclocheilus anshuiensis TaxID=1608454 RepID=A0A671KV92_9TELE